MKKKNLGHYNHKKIEAKWQKHWAKVNLYQTKNTGSKPKCYVLDMFPYPSGDGLHVGHVEGYTATDIYSRFKRMNGFNVLHPMGWDAFGLPAENYAIKNKVNPAVSTKKNINNFRRQLKSLGFSYDWEREINTTDPDYYRWTQWIFLQLYKKGLAYQSFEPINWCPSCQTGLANEDLENKRCERCGSLVEKKPMRQWMLKITDYADRLLADLDSLDWPESVKESQRHWIGRSEGAEIAFPLAGKYKYVLIHGWRSSVQKTFFPWLKRELEARGHEVIALDLPDPALPDINQQADYLLSQVAFDERTIVLGHSLGSLVAYRLLEKLNQPIHKLVLVAGLIEPKFRDKERWAAKILLNWKFDFAKIKQNTGRIVIMEDLQDTIMVEGESLTIQKVLGGEVYRLNAQKAHFCGENEPAILEHCLEQIKVFTTRADTLFGTTYLVLAPEHPLVDNLANQIDNLNEVKNYIKQAGQKTEIERTSLEREKTGVWLKGLTAINPATGEILPVWVADYVLADYGRGAIMAVPAHDERDYLFAKKYKLPIKEVIKDGWLINSGQFDGLDSESAKRKIVDFVHGELVVKYKLRDWVFSRQRYWGEPIPIIHCVKCGVVPVPEKDLPVKLPSVKNYMPSGTGESPLALIDKWVNVKCPRCAGPAKRETNTMPQWAGSSWYYLRFTDPHQSHSLADQKKISAWLPVDVYVGGVEHATRHLIYARFWHKFLYDLGLVAVLEPFSKLKNQGLIAGADGRKMSKRWGNVINPDDVVRDFGADTLRLYEMFMGPFEQDSVWNTENLMGPRRLLEKVWRLADKANSRKTDHRQSIDPLFHRTIKQVAEDIEQFSYNTAISALMILSNDWDKRETIMAEEWESFLKLLAPFAPHLAEELWQQAGYPGSIHLATWPKYHSSALLDESVTLVVQINGKVRDTFLVAPEISQEVVLEMALARESIKKWLAGAKPKKVIFVPGRLINLVT